MKFNTICRTALGATSVLSVVNIGFGGKSRPQVKYLQNIQQNIILLFRTFLQRGRYLFCELIVTRPLFGRVTHPRCRCKARALSVLPHSHSVKYGQSLIEIERGNTFVSILLCFIYLFTHLEDQQVAPPT